MQIKFELTKAQVELLDPLFTEIIAQGKTGDLSSIFAQIYDTSDGGAFVKAVVLNSTASKRIQSATGVKPGKATTPGKEHLVWAAE